MSKVIKNGKALSSVKCKCCFSIYEWTPGDLVYVTEMAQLGGSVIVEKKLACPNCGYENYINFVEESNE